MLRIYVFNDISDAYDEYINLTCIVAHTKYILNYGNTQKNGFFLFFLSSKIISSPFGGHWTFSKIDFAKKKIICKWSKENIIQIPFTEF